MTRTCAAAVALAVLLCGCVEKSKRLSKAEQALASEIVMNAAPKPAFPLDIRFENKVELLGYDLASSRVQEGVAFTVTWYWHVSNPVGDGWTLFTHVADAEKKNRINADALRPSRRLYPADQWKKGDYIKDSQEITLPDDWDSNAALFYLGFWNGPHRLHVTHGPNDGENRANALTLPVALGAAKATAEPPRIIAGLLTTPIVLDGKLTEDAWLNTQPSGLFVQTMTGSPGAFAASARVLYDAEKLYIGFQVQDDHLKCTFKNRDDHLWEQDAVEVMLDPDGDGKNYFEIQISPTNLVFDTRYDSRRSPQPFGDLAWSSRAQANVSLQGMPNDDDEDDGYSVELAMPWQAFAAGPTPAKPPAAGETWRINFFVLDARKKGQRAVGWSAPRIGDFHTLDRFGRVIFAEGADSVTLPAPATKPSAQPSTSAPTH